MINIKELSIGNWVENTNGNIGKVIGITEQGEVIVSYSENSTCYSEPRVLEPIEITPEILEKSGWKVNRSTNIWFAILGENVVITHSSNMKEDETFITIIADGGEIRFAFRYIHQLQNILTLCGINKEIKL